MFQKKSTWLALAVALMLVAPAAHAAKGDMTFGLNGGAVVPLSDYKDGVKTGFGGGVFGDYWVQEQFGLGVNLGYLKNNAKDLPPGFDGNVSIIEIEGHGKWMPGTKDSKVAPYLEAGAGLYRSKLEVSAGGVSADTTFNKFGFHVGGGIGYKASPQVTVGVGASFHMAPSALEVDTPSGGTEKKALQYIRVGLDVTFATSGGQ